LALLEAKIESNPDASIEFHIKHGDIKLAQNDDDVAHFDDQNALMPDSQNECAREGLQKAMDLKKNNRSMWILTDCWESHQMRLLEQIKSAYKKLVREWHPDRHSDPQKKKEAEGDDEKD
jgi:hypothetical protein